MRTHEAGQQATTLETILGKALVRLGFDADGNEAEVVKALGDLSLEAYALGALEAVAITPLDATEVVYKTRVTPATLQRMTRQGWTPWAITNTDWREFADQPGLPIPADWKRKKGEPHRDVLKFSGWVVRYTRPMQPGADSAAETPEPPPADEDHSRGGA
jgi:hypothetical protein